MQNFFYGVQLAADNTHLCFHTFIVLYLAYTYPRFAESLYQNSCNNHSGVIKYKAVYNSVTAYLGDENSYSHAAAVLLVDGELNGYDTISKVIAAASTECDSAVVPVENNVEGAVNEVYDALFDRGLYMQKQLVLPVRHSLIAPIGVQKSDIERILSHPQAIAQCRNYLKGFDVPVVAVGSTSEALGLAVGRTAAIGMKPLPGQAVIDSNIQDSSTNATRFALLGKTATEEGGTVSVAFDLKNEPGTLLAALTVIDDAGINMTRILSRPHRSGDGKYRFFVDFDFCGTAEELKSLFGAIGNSCEAFRYLGRYDVLHA